MADAGDMAVSNKKTIIADKTSNDGLDRVFRTRFTLKSMEFKKNGNLLPHHRGERKRDRSGSG